MKLWSQLFLLHEHNWHQSFGYDRNFDIPKFQTALKYQPEQSTDFENSNDNDFELDPEAINRFHQDNLDNLIKEIRNILNTATTVREAGKIINIRNTLDN